MLVENKWGRMKEGIRVKIKQIRSEAGRAPAVRDTLQALGLGRIGREREHIVNPAIWGMLKKVSRLVRVTEADTDFS